MTIETTHWTATEFAELDLGDARLDKRARVLMERFASDPTASIPTACHGWDETMAAYRFLGNEEVECGDPVAALAINRQTNAGVFSRAVSS